MSRRPFALAASLLLAFPLAHSLPAAHAADVIVEGGTCTVVHSPVERDNVLALSGVFAANWSAEILRDIPGAAEDMSLARIWHADKTSEQLADMPAEVRAAVDHHDRLLTPAGSGARGLACGTTTVARWGRGSSSRSRRCSRRSTR